MYLSDARIKLYERATVAGDVQQVRLMIDVHPVCARRREHPMLHLIEFGQSSNQDHRVEGAGTATKTRVLPS
jgi:hypothetical protein